MNGRKWEPWVLAFALVLPTAVTLAYFWLAAAATPAVQQAVYSVGKLVQFALPAVWVFVVARRGVAWKTGSVKDILLGGLFGLAVCAALGVLYGQLAGTELLADAVVKIQAKVQDLGLASPGSFVALGIFYAIGHSLLEEYYWRWFVYARLTDWIGDRKAIVLSSVGFMLHHVLLLATFFPHSPVAVVLLSLCVLVGGLFWAWLYGRSGSLLGPWLGHLLVDAGIFALGYQLVFG